jgi:hypothetical protein
MHCKYKSEDKLFTELIIRIEISNFSRIRTQNQKFQSKSEISTATSESFDQQFSIHIMIRSSESASIAHYELWNARRESLLTQNQTASEKDMNASSNTEQENMNALFFDYKMIKISINTKLNAWIIAHEAGDIVVFIQHMCHQHDIKIEIHNDMIQMLNNVNEINISLKTQLRTQQTSLQKKIRDKNVIIHHLKITLSQQSTSAFEDWTLKSIKLLNSLLFENSSQNVNNWLSWMQNKLKINKNHFSIEELKIVYIKSWVSEAAIKHIASWMRNTSLNSFLEVEEVLSIINKMYDNLNHHYTTQQQYLKLYQNKIFFHEFWMKFQRFSAELKYNNEILLNDLQHKINSDLQRAMLNEWITNLNEFADICMQVNVRLIELNSQSIIKASAISAARSVASTSSAHLMSLVSSWKKLRILNLDLSKKKLMKKELCFKCKKIEHRAYECFETTQVHEIAANSKNDLSWSK